MMFNKPKTTWAYEFFVGEVIKEQKIYFEVDEHSGSPEQRKRERKIEKKAKKQLKRFPYVTLTIEEGHFYFTRKNPFIVFNDKENKQKIKRKSTVMKKLNNKSITLDKIDFLVPKIALVPLNGRYDIRYCCIVETQYPIDQLKEFYNKDEEGILQMPSFNILNQNDSDFLETLYELN